MKYIIIYLYLAINAFLLILNFNLFSTSINIDLGFGIFQMPPLILVQVIGLVALIAFAIIDGFKELRREVEVSEFQKTILGLEKDSLINNLQHKLKSNNTIEVIPNNEVVEKEVVGKEVV
ncbi:hypothetical protein [Mariniflexile sp.]|uniref:hypothetical protein n=1 Tax=Mariniflexile sp. TaxID=1979402 RepID=UPI003564124F